MVYFVGRNPPWSGRGEEKGRLVFSPADPLSRLWPEQHHTVFAFSKLPDSVSFSFFIRSRTSVGVLFACVIIPAKRIKL